MSIEEIQEMRKSGTYNEAASKLLHYAKNVSDTNSYLNNVKEQLNITISQVGSPTIYWNLSCAEFHWPEFHSRFDQSGPFNSNSKRQSIANNSHIRLNALLSNGSMIIGGQTVLVLIWIHSIARWNTLSWTSKVKIWSKSLWIK